MSMASNLLKALHAEELTIHTAPGLYKAMEEVAKDLKIAMPKFHLVASDKISNNIIMEALASLPNAGSLSRTDIMFTKPLAELYESIDFTKPISEELKAILAHEMHHCANRGSAMAMTRLPLLALPLVAVVATFIYDHAHTKAKKETGSNSPPAQDIVKHIESATEEAKKSLPPEAEHSGFFKNVLYFGKYFAAAAAGLGAGLFVARYGSRYHEFAADLYATRHVANPEVMVSALRKIHKELGQSISEDIHEARKISEVIGEYILGPLAHPTFAERAAHIRGR